jgi:hypothetical protein
MWDETRAPKGQSVSALGLTARDRVRCHSNALNSSLPLLMLAKEIVDLLEAGPPATRANCKTSRLGQRGSAGGAQFPRHTRARPSSSSRSRPLRVSAAARSGPRGTSKGTRASLNTRLARTIRWATVGS